MLAEDLEFIELTNHSDSAVDLSNWLISGGVDLAFAPGSAIAAGESIIAVNFDPAGTQNPDRVLAFRAQYGISPAVRMFEYSGRLDNSGEAVRLERPDPLNNGLHYQVDEMIYDELQPWNSMANGGGLTLQRTSGLHFGNNPIAVSYTHLTLPTKRIV